MYFNIHSGSCAPVERDFPSLATVFSQPLTPEPRQITRAVPTAYTYRVLNIGAGTEGGQDLIAHTLAPSRREGE
jgi:hypothetical protein